LARFEDDEYDRMDPSRVGNPWYVTTLWHAQYLLEANQLERSRSIVEWVKDRMTSTGVLSEQFDADTLQSISVAPLAWSQAEYLSTLLDMITEREPGTAPVSEDKV
jgi:GH15 family glucan-1,4-alpha-glucosidase